MNEALYLTVPFTKIDYIFQTTFISYYILTFLCKVMLEAKTYLKKIAQSIRMFNLSLKKLKLIAKNTGIKGYKSMSKDKLLSMFNTSGSIKENKNIKDIRK